MTDPDEEFDHARQVLGDSLVAGDEFWVGVRRACEALNQRGLDGDSFEDGLLELQYEGETLVTLVWEDVGSFPGSSSVRSIDVLRLSDTSWWLIDSGDEDSGVYAIGGYETKQAAMEDFADDFGGFFLEDIAPTGVWISTQLSETSIDRIVDAFEAHLRSGKFLGYDEEYDVEYGFISIGDSTRQIRLPVPEADAGRSDDPESETPV